MVQNFCDHRTLSIPYLPEPNDFRKKYIAPYVGSPMPALNQLHVKSSAESRKNLQQRCWAWDVQPGPRNDRAHVERYSNTFWNCNHRTRKFVQCPFTTTSKKQHTHLSHTRVQQRRKKAER